MSNVCRAQSLLGAVNQSEEAQAAERKCLAVKWYYIHPLSAPPVSPTSKFDSKIRWKVSWKFLLLQPTSKIEEQKSELFECGARLRAQAVTQPTITPRVKVPLCGAGEAFIKTFHRLPCSRRRSDCRWPTLWLLPPWTCPVSTSENRTIRRPPQGPHHIPLNLGVVRQEPLWGRGLCCIQSPAEVQMMDKAKQVRLCVNHVTVFPSGGYGDQTHFFTAMIAKIFMTNKEIGLEGPSLTPPSCPERLHLALCGLIKSINDL